MKNFELRVMAAATVASGLVSAHGVDHGGVAVEKVAERAIAIADAVIEQAEVIPDDEASCLSDWIQNQEPVSVPPAAPIAEPAPEEPKAADIEE